MYFLSQIRNQFSFFLINYFVDEAPIASSAANRELAMDEAWFNQGFDNMSSSELLEELKKRLDSLKAAESIVGPEAQVLINFCTKVKNGEIAWLWPEDADFKRLSDMACRKVEEYKDLTWEAAQIDEAIQVELARIGGHIDREIADPEGNQVLSEEEKEIDSLETQRIALSRVIYEQLSNAPEWFEVSNQTASVIAAIDNLWEKRLEETSVDWKITELEWINQDIKTLIESIDIDHEIQLFQRKEVDGLNVPLNETEMIEMNALNTEYFANVEALSMKLSTFVSSTENTDSMSRVIELYKQLNTSTINDMTDREKLLFFKNGWIDNLWEIHRLADIALRDEWVVWENWEKLWEVRLDSAHEAYNKILEDDEIKEAITTRAGEVPTFEELDMSDINILDEKWVNLAELFLVNSDGSSFSWEITEWNSYIINFSTNANLAGKMNFAFIARDSQKIVVDWKELDFDENSFKLDGQTYPMKDGSKIDVVSSFDDEWTPEQTQRHEQISDFMNNQGMAANQQRIVQEALASWNPQAIFEWDTLPGWLAGFFVAMILNLGDGRNFKYNADKWIWEDVEDETALTNEWVLNNNRWVYYTDTGERVDISSSFEDLPPGVWSLVNTIYQAESRGNPNIIYWGCPIQPPRPITQMTVREVRRFQDQMVSAGSASSAVWACQIIRGTMDGAIRAGVLDPNQKFDVAAQNKFTLWKMEQRWLNRFMSWQMSDAQFMRSLSQEWASLPKDMWWASYYAWDWLNHALVSPQTMMRHLREIGQW
jgi:hypothetical protein